MHPRIVEIRRSVLKRNDATASALRERFVAEGTLVVNLVSSPGTGKTALLRQTLSRMREQGYRVIALVGDLATDNDARRLAESGAPVRQITTDGCCHLEAEMVARHLADWSPGPCDFLFIENVGNLVCPASYDLGESVRAVLASVTEGEDKPLKYPKLFNSADVAIVTKLDLAEACDFDRRALEGNLRDVQPAIKILGTSAKTGQGIDEWLDYLIEHHANLLRHAPASDHPDLPAATLSALESRPGLRSRCES